MDSRALLLVANLVLAGAFVVEATMAVRFKNTAEEALRLVNVWRAAAQTCPLYETKTIPLWYGYAQFRSASI